MFRVLVFSLFFLNVSVNAQQLQSLKIIKTKYDSITKINKEEYLLALNENNQERIIAAQNKIREFSFKREKEYQQAVEDFLKNQKFAEPSNLPIDSSKAEIKASYSLGIEKLYKEVHDFVFKNTDFGDSEFDFVSSKIHFLIQNDNTLFVEKVEGANPNFNRIALLAFLMTEGTWTSTSQYGRNVKSKFVLPLTLKLE